MIRFNEQNEIIQNEEYRAILAAVDMKNDRGNALNRSLEELSGLAEAANIQVLGNVIQTLEKPNTATYLGKGKVEELCQLCKDMEADMVIFDNELSGMQLRNLEDALGVKVIDRTILILDIFAARAVSREGKLQVELAQLQYRLPRLTGFGKSLSRLGGGIGTRGPGEKKLETDRRHISRRMDEIKDELKEVKNNRRTQRSQREKAGIPAVALVGYTNSGKSAIMNRFLEHAEKEEKTVFEKNMLFATLDTFQRKIRLESGHEFILIDTVGFVSKLPHSLVDAFKATLEEVSFADLLIHVVDCSFEDHEFQRQVTEKVLKEIGAGDKESILVYNKVDLFTEEERMELLFPPEEETQFLSAKSGEGMEDLMERIRKHLFGDRTRARLVIPYDRGDVVSWLCGKYEPEKLDYLAEGTLVIAELAPEDLARCDQWRKEEE
ncbi:MAG: GTPase HflX [Clostridiales bacterium]|nr:GTPase HflX [Clostridiales bacterium]